LIIDGTIGQGADWVPCLLNIAGENSASGRKEETMAVGRYHRQEIFYPIGRRRVIGDLRSLSDENTSEANYVWLPVVFDADTPRIRFLREWKI